LFSLKKVKKKKKKEHIEALIYKAYIVEEISAFILYNSDPHMRTRISRIRKHDDSGELPSSMNLSIFSNHGWPIPKNTARGKTLDRNRV
jgi:hypothetical protein